MYPVPVGNGRWIEVRAQHVVLIANGDVVWRSTGTFSSQSLGSVVAGAGWLAFTVYGNGASGLYMSFVPGSERQVSENEDAVGVSAANGLIVARWPSGGGDADLLVRRPDGIIDALIATSVSASYPELETGTLLYSQGKVLRRTDGIRSWTVARLGAIGVPGLEAVDRLADGRILLSGRRSMALLARDGQVITQAMFARIPQGGTGYLSVAATDNLNGLTLRTDPTTGGIIVVQAMWWDENAGGGPGWEGVYALSPKGSTPRLLFGKRLKMAVCAHGSEVSWHGRWLLYSTCEGRVVVIDTFGRRPALDLSAVSRFIPMPKEERGYGASASWASFGSRAGMAVLEKVS